MKSEITMEMTKMKPITKTKWRAIDITVGKGSIKCFGFWNVFWGTDIFFNGLPFMKLLVLANIIVWLLF